MAAGLINREQKMKNKMLRSRKWFDNPDDREMTALYLERYLNSVSYTHLRAHET